MSSGIPVAMPVDNHDVPFKASPISSTVAVATAVTLNIDVRVASCLSEESDHDHSTATAEAAAIPIEAHSTQSEKSDHTGPEKTIASDNTLVSDWFAAEWAWQHNRAATI